MPQKGARLPRRRYDERRQPALLAQLVEHLHGKEGVDGSSPSEGSRKAPVIGAFVPRLTRTRSKLLRVEQVMEQPEPRREGRRRSRTVRLAVKSLALRTHSKSPS